LLASFKDTQYVPILIDAIDGRSGLSAEFESLINRKSAEIRVGRPLSDAEFACALSHRKVYETILRKELPGAVILEDDAIPTELFWSFLDDRGYCEANLVQLDHMDARVKLWGRRRWKPGISLLLLAENASLTTGYSLSAAAAKYLLNQATPLAGLADWPCDLMAIGPVVTQPPLIRHPDPNLANSDIEPGRRALVSAMDTGGSRWRRFLRKSYWKRWWFKRTTRKIS
jgi:glycosyl transferase family 25